MADSSESPHGIDTSVAHTARVWDFWLGGKDHYESDREVGTQVLEFLPNMVETARADRAYLGRAVRFLAAEAGMRQFLDIGTGLPTADNTHQVAQAVAPESRIVYVDNDPLVLVHARALLTSTPEGATAYIEADLRDPGPILKSAARTLDFSQPIAVMLLGVLNFIPDYDEAREIVRTLMDAAPSGSYLAVAHASNQANPARAAAAEEFWNNNATPPITFRDGAEIEGFFEGLELLEPGVVSCSRWRPNVGTPDVIPEVDQFGAIGRKHRSH
ncbi:SAM-dependent methyltransferase [Actinomadura sp. 3N407]|uniref:SAM-dependent methyltransferase n=1 Tax=Actinomadura sp. 3N407 TaxID=3457423 RepID=UPI003FCE7CD4